MQRLRFRAGLAPFTSALIIGAGLTAPATVLLELRGPQAAPAATSVAAHQPATKTSAGSAGSTGSTSATQDSSAHANQPPGQSKATCNPKNHYCPGSPSPTCTDDPLSVTVPSAVSCQVDDNITDPYCGVIPDGYGGGICEDGVPGATPIPSLIGVGPTPPVGVRPQVPAGGL